MVAILVIIVAPLALSAPRSAAGGEVGDVVIITAAGSGAGTYGGDGGPATHAHLNSPRDVASDANGNFYIPDSRNHRVRRVDAVGIITTVAGTGVAGYSGDGGRATDAQLNNPVGVTVDRVGNLYIADANNNLVRRIDAAGVITTVAGVYPPSTPVDDSVIVGAVRNYARLVDPVASPGDGGPATLATLAHPSGVALDGNGNLYVADTSHNRVRKVAPGSDGVVAGSGDETITTVAGNGEPVSGGDGGPAVAAGVVAPAGVVVDRSGSFYVSEGNLFVIATDGRAVQSGGHRVRKVDTSGIITTFAGVGPRGNGNGGYSGDGGPATAAELNYPRGLAIDGEGSVYIADEFNHRVRRVDAGGTIATVAGNGSAGYAGDGGAPTDAELNFPSGLDVDTSGVLRIADSANHRIRRMDTAQVHWSAVMADAPDPVSVGQELTYTLTVTSTTADLAGVVVHDPLPSTVSFVSATASQGSGCTATASQVDCDLGSLAANWTATVTIVVIPTAKGLLTNTATVVSDGSGTRTAVAETKVPDSACGRTVLTDTTLATDIGPCAGDGLLVVGDHLTVDLGGHRVFGFPGPGSGNQAGIRLTKSATALGVTGVTVRNGTVSDFDGGVVLERSNSNTVRNLTVEDNIGPDDYVTAYLGDGIVLIRSANNVLDNNTVRHNGIYDGIGVLGSDSDGNTIQNNAVADTVGSSDGGPAGQGVIVNAFFDSSDRAQTIEGTHIVGNTITRNASAGSANLNHVKGTIEDNIIEGNGSTNSAGNGIGLQLGLGLLDSQGAMVVQRNQVHHNGVDGIRVVAGNHGNRVLDNNAADNNANPSVNWYEKNRPGYDLHDSAGVFGGNAGDDCADNVWRGNTWGTGGYQPRCVAAGGSGPNPPRTIVPDFDADTYTDISVFRPLSGAWYVQGAPTVNHGRDGDAAVPADYDGDGDSDIAVFRPSSGGWHMLGKPTLYHGRIGDIPVPADYDGDGDADPAVFRPSSGGWYIVGEATVFFGRDGDIPVPGHFDADPGVDLAVFRPSSGAWYVRDQPTVYHGRNGDVPVPADYDGDTDTDIAVFRPQSGGWYVQGQATVFFGRSGDVPVPAHYAGAAGTDIAVFRPSSGGWYRPGLATVYFGRSGDAPLPLPHAIRQAFR